MRRLQVTAFPQATPSPRPSPGRAEVLNLAVVEHAEATGEWSFPRDFRDTDMPGWAMAEFIVGEATLGWEPAEIGDLLAHLRDRACHPKNAPMTRRPSC